MANQQDFACCNDNHEVFSCYEFNCQHCQARMHIKCFLKPRRRPELAYDCIHCNYTQNVLHLVVCFVSADDSALYLQNMFQNLAAHPGTDGRASDFINTQWNDLMQLRKQLIPIINRAPLALAYLQHLQNDNSKFTLFMITSTNRWNIGEHIFESARFCSISD